MPIPFEVNEAIKYSMRREFVTVPWIPASLPDELEDTTEEKIKAMRLDKKTHMAMLEAIRRGREEMDREREERRRRREEPPHGTGVVSVVNLSIQLGSTGSAVRTSNTFPYPVILQEVSFNLLLTYNTGNRFNVVWGESPGLSITRFVGIVGKLFDDEHEDGYLLQAGSLDEGAGFSFRPRIVINVPNMRFMLAIYNVPAAPARCAMQLVIEELSLEALRRREQVFVGLPGDRAARIGSMPRLPNPRHGQENHPRAVMVGAVQKGGWAQRKMIAWESLAPHLKRLVLNNQAAGIVDPTVEPVW